MPGTGPMIGKPVVVSPKVPVHANSTVVSSFGKSRCSLRRSIFVLRLSKCVALLRVRNVFVFAAAKDPAFRGRPDIEIGIGRLPDAAFARPQAPPRPGGTVAMAQVEVIL